MANLSKQAILSPTPFYTATPVANAAANTNNYSPVVSALPFMTMLITFTVGSLTNAIVTPQGTFDGTNFFNLTDPGALTMTATGKYAIPLCVAGLKAVRAQVTSTGTVTSSVISIDFAFHSQTITN